MTENTLEKAHVIDNSVREKMALLDKYGENFFSEKITIIKNFAPYVKYVQRNVPVRTLEHMIIFIRKGFKTLNINFKDYHLKEGSLLFIPASSTLINMEQSDDYNVNTVAFLTSEADRMRLSSLYVTGMQLSDTNQKIVDNYLSLMRQIANEGKAEIKGMDFLILSLLTVIREWNREQNEPMQPKHQSKAAELCEQFVRHITTGGIPERNPDHYAKIFSVSKGYLSQSVAKNSNKTIMEWINEKTILEAKLQLVESDQTLETIAENLHLNSAPQFIKFFQKYENETPTAYRKRITDMQSFPF